MSGSDLQVNCPACQQCITVPANWVGKRRPCPNCKEWVTMPAAPAGGGGGGGGASSARGAADAAAATSAPGGGGEAAAASASGSAKPLSFADRMKAAAERGSTQIRHKEEQRGAKRSATPASGSAAAGGGGAGGGADSLSPAILGPQSGGLGAGPATGGSTEWGRAPVSADDEQRRSDREQKLLDASFAPEKIGRISVILCGISFLILLVSVVVLLFGAGATVLGQGGSHEQTAAGFGGGLILALGICAFGFSPVCAICGFILGLHSVMRSRHDKLWGALGTGLNGLLVIPPLVLILLTLMR